MTLGVIYLSFQLLINGQWVEGKDVEGWHDREAPTWEVCTERMRNVAEFGAALQAPGTPFIVNGVQIDDMRAFCMRAE